MAEKLPQAALDVMNERFGKDSLIALATLDGERPSVRNVNALYEDGAFYVITHALSGKIVGWCLSRGVALQGGERVAVEPYLVDARRYAVEAHARRARLNGHGDDPERLGIKAAQPRERGEREE